MELAERVGRIVRSYGRFGVSIDVVIAALNVPTNIAREAIDDSITFGLIVATKGNLYPPIIAGVRAFAG